MSWAAEITRKGERDGQVSVVVEYSDGTQSIAETYSARMPSGEWPYNLIRVRLSELDEIAKWDVATGPVTLPEPPQPDAGRHAWRTAVTHWQFLRLLVQDGLLPADDKRYTDAAASVVAGIDSYLD